MKNSIFPIRFSILSLLLAASLASAQSGPLANWYIYTYAGNGTYGYSGDGGPATSAEINQPVDVALDAAGNLYISDLLNNRIRKVDAVTGIITTVAGNGTVGDSGDGGPATSAEISWPGGIASDTNGNLYIADSRNFRIRKVDASTGIITTFAGGGNPSVGIGDGGPATSAFLYFPSSVALDAAGNLYITDTTNYRIRKVDAATGIITTVAGDGIEGHIGDGGPATSAELDGPSSLALDSAENLYFADSTNNCIRQVNKSTGNIIAFAGTCFPWDDCNLGADEIGDGGPAISAELHCPGGVALDLIGNLYISDVDRIRRVDAVTGIITTVVGGVAFTGSLGDGGPAFDASLFGPGGLILNPAGYLFIADNENRRIRIVRPEALVATTTALTALPTTLTVGQTLTLTATVTAASGATPTGTVTFYDGSVSLGSAALNGSGVAALTLTPVAGNYSITASYGGSSTDAPSASSPAIAVTVNAIPTTTALTALPATLTVGQTLTLTATVTAASGGTPTGTVTFFNGTASLGSGSLNNSGVATLNTTSLPVGNDSITAAYAGDINFTGSNSSSLSIQVSASEIGEWTWMGGSSTMSQLPDGAYSQPGVYGTLGTPAAGNIPGGRNSAVTWTDPSGHLWLFGGFAPQGNGDAISFNDLWEFNPSTNEWAWMGGSSAIGDICCGQPGVYGTLGTPAAGNIPGGRYSASGWTDNSGNLWLFGGIGYDSNGDYGFLNDLWEFNPSTNLWAWMSGSSMLLACGPAGYQEYCGQPGVYGTLGTPAAGNVPGGRNSAVTWTGASGHLWLFGGEYNDPNNKFYFFNDLWEFNPSTNLWAWMGGSSTCCEPGVYGTLGKPAVGNIPGGRYGASGWTDSSGSLWLFGGYGFNTNGSSPDLNDLWEFNPSTNEWAWMGGNTVNSSGVYGTLGTPSAGNIPGARNSGNGWTGNSGKFWLLGGDGYGANGDCCFLNDLWEFDSFANLWTWMGGSSASNDSGVYGSLGVPVSGNVPGARTSAASWNDISGNFWLFGGYGFDASGNVGWLNDLWVYQTAPSLPAAATPTFSVPAGSYSTSQSVTISDTTPNAIIYYATNGIPTTSSSVYSTPIAVSSSETLEAIATATGYSNSHVASATYNVTVTTTTALTVSANSLTAGQTLTLTATVMQASGATPTGTVTFYNNGTASLGSANLNSSGVAQLTLTPTAGNYSVTASYGGSATDAPSTSSPPIAVAVSAVSTTTNLIAVPTSMSYGQTLTLTATVTPASGAVPTGTVTFFNGITSLGSSSLNNAGVATLVLTPAVGTYSITASYGGSANDTASVSLPPVAVTVIASATTTTLSASPNPAPFGAAVTFTATVSCATATPAGSVSFYDGAALIGTATLASGMATYSTSSLSVGSHNMTAAYAGGAGFNASTSTVVVEVISPADFSISASPMSQSAYTGEAASYTVTITPGAGFNLPVALTCSQLPANTTCSFSPATVPAGSKSSTLVVQTTAPGPAATASVFSTKVALACLLLLFIPRRLRRYRNGWPMFLAILALLTAGAAIAGCGAPGPLSGGTPVGAQTVAVTGVATNGSQTLTHTVTVTLNVKSLF